MDSVRDFDDAARARNSAHGLSRRSAYLHDLSLLGAGERFALGADAESVSSGNHSDCLSLLYGPLCGKLVAAQRLACAKAALQRLADGLDWIHQYT